MLILNAEQIRAAMPLSLLVERLETAFRSDYLVPPRQVANVPGGVGDRLFVSMPAFENSGAGVVKLATIVPDNSSRGLPTVQAVIAVFSHTGSAVALLDGTIITLLRTGAASALASKYLSREESSHILVIGTGALAPVMAAAHCTVRPIRQVNIWGRSQERAAATVAATRELLDHDIEVRTIDSLEGAVATADIICCATSSPRPVLAGKYLKPGAFVDLVGSFSPSTREADDDVIMRSRIYVDTFEGALAEAGDLIIPLRDSKIRRENIYGELADLVRGRVAGRGNRDEIITFKSVGTAIEDLAAALLAVELVSK